MRAGIDEEDRARDHDRGERVDHRRDPEAYGRIDEERQGRRARARHEEGDDEVLEGEGDGGEEARGDARHRDREDDPSRVWISVAPRSRAASMMLGSNSSRRAETRR